MIDITEALGSLATDLENSFEETDRKLNTCWVITRTINEYDQDGDYFVAVYFNKPTFQQLKDLLKLDDVTTGKLTRGGGRQDSEHEWYYLTEISENTRYIDK